MFNSKFTIDSPKELIKYINDRIEFLEKRLKSAEKPSVVNNGVNNKKVAELNAQLLELEILKDKINFK